MLKYSDFSYLDISLALGFSSQSAFISVFKKVTGITPKKYKEFYLSSDSSVRLHRKGARGRFRVPGDRFPELLLFLRISDKVRC